MNFFQSTLFLLSWFLICFNCSKTPNWSATFNEAGLVNVQELDSTIKVRLAYSSSNNVIGYDIYGDLDQAYLRPEAAKKLVIAQKIYRHIIQLTPCIFLMPHVRVVFNSYYGTNRNFQLIKGVNT